MSRISGSAWTCPGRLRIISSTGWNLAHESNSCPGRSRSMFKTVAPGVRSEAECILKSRG